MLKKLIVLGGAGALLLGLFFGRSHVLTTVGLVKQSVTDSVPITFELKRARQMVKDLDPEIKKNLRQIAQEEVEVDKLEKRVESTEELLAKKESDIQRFHHDLAKNKPAYEYSNVRYSPHEVRAELTSLWSEFKTEVATLKSVKKILTHRQSSLQAANEKLEGMLESKRQLEVEIEHLEARLAMVDVAQTTSDFNFDDSHLARTRELIESIDTRIEVAERLVNADVPNLDRIRVDEPQVDEDVSDEIARYFGEDRFAIEALTTIDKN